MKNILRKFMSKQQQYILSVLINRITKKNISNNNKSTLSFRKISNGKNTFFGYYDVTPFNKKNDLILFLSTDVDKKNINYNEEITLGYYIVNRNKFMNFAKTKAWCWQQGCRLQWIPNKDIVIYNDYDNNDKKYISILYNIEKKCSIKKYDFPIYHINNDGTRALTLNFSRLHRLRPGYGYINTVDSTKDILAPSNEGVWLCDLKENKQELIISLKELLSYQPDETMYNAEHYVNHLCFNPSGNRFLFFHLWNKNNRRYGRLITSDLEGKDICVLTNEGHVSHYCWIDDKHMLLYSTKKNVGKGYHIYEDRKGYVKSLFKNELTIDGHPSINNDLLLTDTKPNKLGNQNLLLCNLITNKLYKLGSFFQPFKYFGEFRCDLHPRFSNDGKYICFDSAHEGSRAMYILNTEETIINTEI